MSEPWKDILDSLQELNKLDEEARKKKENPETGEEVLSRLNDLFSLKL
jgi:hypothetical protein